MAGTFVNRAQSLSTTSKAPIAPVAVSAMMARSQPISSALTAMTSNSILNLPAPPCGAEDESRTLLHDFKYRRKIHLHHELGRLLKTGLDDPRFEPYLADGILVPCHCIRKGLEKENSTNQRNWHQALENSPACVSNALKRKRNTATQTRYSRSERLKNLRGAFELRTTLQNRRFKAKKSFLSTMSSPPDQQPMNAPESCLNMERRVLPYSPCSAAKPYARWHGSLLTTGNSLHEPYPAGSRPVLFRSLPPWFPRLFCYFQLPRPAPVPSTQHRL